MIFVTVGTHEQPFDRLIRAVDELKKDGTIPADETVFMQTGFCTYEPRHCEWNRLLSYREMEQLISQARIIITHGGPSSFLAPLRLSKIPIVMPRSVKYGEHVNDHQVDFVAAMAKQYNNIIPVYSTTELIAAVRDYDRIVSDMPHDEFTHNAEFCTGFEHIVNELFADDISGRYGKEHV